MVLISIKQILRERLQSVLAFVFGYLTPRLNSRVSDRLQALRRAQVPQGPHNNLIDLGPKHRCLENPRFCKSNRKNLSLLSHRLAAHAAIASAREPFLTSGVADVLVGAVACLARVLCFSRPHINHKERGGGSWLQCNSASFVGVTCAV